MSGRHRTAALAAVALGALALAGGALAHARLSPAESLSGETQLYSLAVPTEKEGLTTTRVVLGVPTGFAIDSFVASPGWKRTVQSSGSGEDAVVQKVTWSGGHTPTDEDSLFQFLGRPASSGTYTFQVQQTYSDGSIVDWAGPESADAPAPTIEAASSLAGGGGSSTLTIVALALGAVALVVALGALLRGAGGRELA